MLPNLKETRNVCLILPHSKLGCRSPMPSLKWVKGSKEEASLAPLLSVVVLCALRAHCGWWHPPTSWHVLEEGNCMAAKAAVCCLCSLKTSYPLPPSSTNAYFPDAWHLGNCSLRNNVCHWEVQSPKCLASGRVARKRGKKITARYPPPSHVGNRTITGSNQKAN